MRVPVSVCERVPRQRPSPRHIAPARCPQDTTRAGPCAADALPLQGRLPARARGVGPENWVKARPDRLPTRLSRCPRGQGLQGPAPQGPRPSQSVPHVRSRAQSWEREQDQRLQPTVCSGLWGTLAHSPLAWLGASSGQGRLQASPVPGLAQQAGQPRGLANLGQLGKGLPSLGMEGA